MVTRKKVVKKKAPRYGSVKTVKKPVKVSFKTKSGRRVSFKATKVVKKKTAAKRRRK